MEGDNSSSSSALVVDPEAPKETEQPVDDGKTETSETVAKSPGKTPTTSSDAEKGKITPKGIRKILALVDEKDEDENKWEKFSAAEMKVLVREVELRKEALFGDYKEGESPKYRWLIWQEVAEKVNEVNPAVHRNLEQVRIKWFDYKDPSNRWEKRIKRKPGYKHSTGMFFKRKPGASVMGDEGSGAQSGAEGTPNNGQSGDVVKKLPLLKAKVDEVTRLKGILSTLNEDKASKAIKYLSHSSQRQGIALMAAKAEPKESKGIENKADETGDEASKDSSSAKKADSVLAGTVKKTYSAAGKGDSPKSALKWMLGADGEVLNTKEVKVKSMDGVQKMEPKTLFEMVNFLTKITTKPGEGDAKGAESSPTEKKAAGVKRPAEGGMAPEPKRVMFGGTSEELKALLKSVDPSKVKQVKMKHPKTGKEMVVTKILAPEALRVIGNKKISVVGTKPMAPKAPAPGASSDSDEVQIVEETSTKATKGGPAGAVVSGDKSATKSTPVDGKGSLPRLDMEDDIRKVTAGAGDCQKLMGKGVITSKMTPLQPSTSAESEASTSEPTEAGSKLRTSDTEMDDANEADCEMQPDQDESSSDAPSDKGKLAKKPAKSSAVGGEVSQMRDAGKEEPMSVSTRQNSKMEAEEKDCAGSSEPSISNLQSQLKTAIQSTAMSLAEVENTNLNKEVIKESPSEKPGKPVGPAPTVGKVELSTSGTARSPQAANDLAQRILKAVEGSAGMPTAGKKLNSSPIQPGDVRLLKVGGKTVKVLIVNNDEYSKTAKSSGMAQLQEKAPGNKVTGVVPSQGSKNLVPGVGLTPVAPGKGLTTVAPGKGLNTVTSGVRPTAAPSVGSKATPSAVQTVVSTAPANVVTQMVPIMPTKVVPIVAPNVIPVSGTNILSVVSPAMATNVIPIVGQNLVTIAQPMNVVKVPVPISTSSRKLSTDMPVIETAGVPSKTVGNVVMNVVTPTVNVGVKNVLAASKQGCVETSPGQQFKGFKGFAPVVTQPTGILGSPIANMLSTSSATPKVRLVPVPPKKILPKGAVIRPVSRKPNILSAAARTVSSSSSPSISMASFGVKRTAPTVVKAGGSKLKVRVVKDKDECKELEKKQHPLVKAALSGKPIDFQEELKKLDPEERNKGAEDDASKGHGTTSAGNTLSGVVTSSQAGRSSGKADEIKVIASSSSSSLEDKKSRVGSIVSSTPAKIRVKSTESLQSIHIASPGTVNKRISLSQIAVLNSSSHSQSSSPIKGKRKQELVVKTLDNSGGKTSRSFGGNVIEEAVDMDDCIIVEEVDSRFMNPPEVFCVDSNDSYGVEVH